jgi:hypothetical protein
MVDDLGARLVRGESIYLHCWGGRGRAGTVGACLIAKLYGWVAASRGMGAGRALSRGGRAGRGGWRRGLQARLGGEAAAECALCGGPGHAGTSGAVAHRRRGAAQAALPARRPHLARPPSLRARQSSIQALCR